jgi:hypothetical protein
MNQYEQFKQDLKALLDKYNLKAYPVQDYEYEGVASLFYAELSYELMNDEMTIPLNDTLFKTIGVMGDV